MVGHVGATGECMREAGLSVSGIGACKDHSRACYGWRDDVLVEKGSDWGPLSGRSGRKGGKTKIVEK